MIKQKLYPKIFLILIIALIAKTTIAQDNKFVDSLEQVVFNAATDTGVIGAYGDLFLAFIHTEPQKALIYAEKGLSFSKEKKKSKSVSQFLNNIGYYYQLQGNVSKALDFYSQSLFIKKEIGDKKGEAMTLVNIGNLYYEASDTDHALTYFLNALEIFDQIQDPRGRAYCLNNVGAIYEEEQNFTKALDFYKHSLKIKQEINDKPGTVRCLVNIGVIHSYLFDFTKALKLFKEALVIDEPMQDKELIYIIYNNLGETCMKMKKNKDAEEYLENALSNATDLDALDEIHSLYERITENYIQMGDYRNAYIYQAEYIKLHDSIFSSKHHEKIKLEKLKHEKELSLLKKNISEINDKYAAIKLVLSLLTVFFLIFFSFYFIRNFNRKKRNKPKIL